MMKKKGFVEPFEVESLAERLEAKRYPVHFTLAVHLLTKGRKQEE